MPFNVFKNIGKNDAKIIIIILDSSPIPNHKISIGTKASGGVLRINSNSGLKYSYIFLFTPNTTPSGIAINELIKNLLISFLHWHKHLRK